MRDCDLLPENVSALFELLTNMCADKVNGHRVVRARDNLTTILARLKPSLDHSKPTMSANEAVGRTKLSNDGLTNRMYLDCFRVTTKERNQENIPYWSKMPSTSLPLSCTSRLKRLASIKSESHCTKT